MVKSLVHATQILHAFHHAGETLRLRDVVERTGLNKGMCFRLLFTLHQCGFVEKLGEHQFRLLSQIHPRKRYRIGYANQGQDSSFPREVHTSLMHAADAEGIELLVFDNRYRAKVALRNADLLVREKVDLVIEFQTDESVAPAIAAKYLEAAIPIIAIDLPHPGATYFGANNYEAGLIAGRHLARFARRKWEGAVDQIILLELKRAGSLARARMRGVLAGIRETLKESDAVPVVTLDGDGQFKTSLEKMRKHLQQSRASRMLVGAANDPSAMGAARAIEEAGRGRQAAVVGQNAEPDARQELREARSPFIASVAYFPERYGEGLIRVALDLLAQKHVPPAVFIKHQLVTPDNVDHLYPNDELLGFGSGQAARG